MDVADINVDTRKTVIRIVHAKSLCKIYEKLCSTVIGKRIILNGFKAAGITGAINDSRSTETDSLMDPFDSLCLND